MKKRSWLVTGVGGLLFAGLAVRLAHSMWALPTDWPVHRLIANQERFLAEHPGDVDGTYNLARIHGYAFVLETGHLAAWGEPEAGEPGRIADMEFQAFLSLRQQEDTPKATFKPPPEELWMHLAQGVRLHREAASLAPERAELHLGLAYLLDKGAPSASKVDTTEVMGLPAPVLTDPTTGKAPVETAFLRKTKVALGSDDAAEREAAERTLLSPEWFERAIPILSLEGDYATNPLRRDAVGRILTRYWKERAIGEYARAFELACEPDLRLPFRTAFLGEDDLQGFVSYEAGQSFMRLVQERTPSPAETERLSLIEKHLSELENKPAGGFITPIVLSLTPTASLIDLLSDAAVSFDLDGDLEPELWPWLKPDTGLLVWDPDHRGAITSGRQLFGSASGWFFFPDGYRVMAALDDDGDGWLRARELAGIAVWFDRDSDGVSDAGEVTPVEELGIAGLETRATGREGLSLVNPRGLELADGRRLPTYDWVTSPAPAAAP